MYISRHQVLYTLHIYNKTSKNSQRCNVLFICQVAAYEFSFQVRINSFEASELYTQRHLSKSAVTPKATPLIRPCYVQATGM